jgi:hypothetical protein
VIQFGKRLPDGKKQETQRLSMQVDLFGRPEICPCYRYGDDVVGMVWGEGGEGWN